MLSFITESSENFQETATVGGFNNGSSKNTFDSIFTETYNLMASKGVDVMHDINDLLKNKAKMDAFKSSLLSELYTENKDMNGDVERYGTAVNYYDQISSMFDNCVEDLVKESTRVGNLLPIKAIDFPILVKQQLKLATKDIMQTEVTKTPIVKKHIEQTYIVSNNDKSKRWKYPQCFFTDDFKEIFDEGKGLPIKNTDVTLPQFNYNIVENLSDGDVKKDNITFDLRIVEATASVEGQEYVIPLNPAMRINMSDNTWLGGAINVTLPKKGGSGDETVEIRDHIMGTVDFTTNTVSLSCANGKITKVKFAGYLSNERNERHITFDYAREEREWKIEDGTRVNVPYSLEELEDTKALMQIDLYQKTYNNLSDYMAQMEDSQILSWLDDMFEQYKGIEVPAAEMLDWAGWTYETAFDFDTTSITTALPCEYIEKMLKFKIDGVITDIADNAKMEDMTFVVYGNPRLIRFLDSVVNWVTRPGSTRNGVKLDYGYGIMTSGDVKVQVVSTKKVNAKYDDTDQVFDGLRIIPFPLSSEQFTFKHFKYTTHILTAQNSAYRAPDLPGGSMTNLMGVSRYTNSAIQGIQGKVYLQNAEQYVQLGRNYK